MRRLMYSIAAAGAVTILGYNAIQAPADISEVIDYINRNGHAIQFELDGQIFRANRIIVSPSLEVTVFGNTAKNHLAVKGQYGEMIDFATALRLYADGRIDKVKAKSLENSEIQGLFQDVYDTEIMSVGLYIDVQRLAELQSNVNELQSNVNRQKSGLQEQQERVNHLQERLNEQLQEKLKMSKE